MKKSQNDSSKDLQVGIDYTYYPSIDIVADHYFNTKVIIDITIFMNMTFIIFITIIGFDKFLNEEDEEEE